MVPQHSAIAEVSGVTNAVAIDGDFCGSLLLVGPGAGAKPTASAVASDILDIARGLVMPPFVTPTRNLKPYKKAKLGAHQGAYYVRLSRLRPARRHGGDRQAHGRPRGLAREHRAAAAARRRCPGIGARLKPGAPALVIMITHETTEEAIRQALDAIEQDGKVSERPQMIRIEKLQRRTTGGRGGGMVHGRRERQVRASTACSCSRSRASPRRRRSLRRACAAAATRRPPTRPPSTPCAASSAKLPIRGTVVIGEGEMDEAPMLYIGEKVGSGEGPEVDIAVDPLEGTTICAKAMPNALAVLAISERGGLLHAPDMYMNKIAIGPGYRAGPRRSRRAAGRQPRRRSPRPRACRSPRSRPASSIGRATPS